VKRWPALDVRLPAAPAGEDLPGLFAAWLDDYAPTAIAEIDRADGEALAWRVFFATPEARAVAAAALGAADGWPRASAQALDVDDEAWAERSQAALTAIRAGRIVVTPPWDRAGAGALAAEARDEDGTAGDPVVVVIEPSMGFGTGHHESTRLCLAALQALPIVGRRVVDVGTGSGVLAIAATLLGAAPVLALDDDPDALDSARANVALNPETGGRVEIRAGNLLTDPLPPADVVVANLTGALLRRCAAPLAAAVAPGGALVVSGFTIDERLAVEHAFAPLAVADARDEHGWLALTFRTA
jgi:ribosomal protein L11 methyltransferase